MIEEKIKKAIDEFVELVEKVSFIQKGDLLLAVIDRERDFYFRITFSEYKKTSPFSFGRSEPTGLVRVVIHPTPSLETFCGVTRKSFTPKKNDIPIQRVVTTFLEYWDIANKKYDHTLGFPLRDKIPERLDVLRQNEDEYTVKIHGSVSEAQLKAIIEILSK